MEQLICTLLLVLGAVTVSTISLRWMIALHPGNCSESMFSMYRNLAKCLLVVTLLLPIVAQAMTIVQFDKMDSRDQDEYLGELVMGAQRVLKEQSRLELAEQVHKLFTTKDPDSNISIGLTEFNVTLTRARVFDLERYENNSNAKRLEVEDPMIVTLRKNGIDLPPSFLTVGATFRPKYPPQNK